MDFNLKNEFLNFEFFILFILLIFLVFKIYFLSYKLFIPKKN